MAGFCSKFVVFTASLAVILGILFYLNTDPIFYSLLDSAEETTMAQADKSWKDAKSVYDFNYTDIDGVEQSMERFQGHVLIIANVASKCGFTKANYEQLEELFQKYANSKGLRILGMPCNQFASQEPGNEASIKDFVCTNYKVTFDMSSKVEVNGDGAHPLWKYLKAKQGGTFGDFAKWNFTKFIVNKNGQVVKRYAPTTEPKDIEEDLLKYFGEP